MLNPTTLIVLPVGALGGGCAQQLIDIDGASFIYPNQEGRSQIGSPFPTDGGKRESH